jgi:hypothetical protein
VAEKAVEVARIASQLKPISNPNMSSDLATAISLAGAALEGALANVGQSGFNSSGFARGRGFREPNAETRRGTEAEGLTNL